MRIDDHYIKCDCGNLKFKKEEIFVISKENETAYAIEINYVCTKCGKTLKFEGR